MAKKEIFKYSCILILCWLVSVKTTAQQRLDADELFNRARNAAFDNRWAEARRLSRELLSHYPDYYDAIILIGRTYAWELKTDSARMVVMPLLDIEPDSYDALTLLANNEIWGGRYDEAMEFIDLALMYYPTDQDFLFKRASVYNLKNDNTNTIKALLDLLTVNPDHVQANDLLNMLLSPQPLIDEWYAKAENETRAGNWRLSRRYCRLILEEDPDHFPASLLMASNFAFENRFDSARIVSSNLHRAHPNNYDLLDLMVNIEIWNRRYRDALTQVERALAAHPNDENFLYKKAHIQYLARNYSDALRTLDQLLEINPGHEDGIALRNHILQNRRFRDYVFLEEHFEWFRDPIKSRKLITSAGLAKWTRHGTYIGRISAGGDLYYRSREYLADPYAVPPRIPVFQFEAEAYQDLFPGSYLWLNYAYSHKNDFFPLHRGGAEYFQRLPRYFEASLGMRFLYWTEIALIYTGSLSWLHNRNYLAFRTFFSQPNSRWVNTNILTYRRYFSPRPEYVFALVGYGNYSDDFLHLNPDPGSSFLAQVGIHKFISPRWFFLASVGYAHDDGYRNRYTASAGVRYYFNMFR